MFNQNSSICDLDLNFFLGMNNESKAKISNKNQPTPTSCHFRGVYLSHPNTRKLDFTPDWKALLAC